MTRRGWALVGTTVVGALGASCASVLEEEPASASTRDPGTSAYHRRDAELAKVHFSGVPEMLEIVAPAYSFACEDGDGPTRSVIVAYTVREDGMPGELSAGEGSEPCFADAALAAVAQWRYPPLTEWPADAPRRLAARISFALDPGVPAPEGFAPVRVSNKK